jgi:hypothetical protein
MFIAWDLVIVSKLGNFLSFFWMNGDAWRGTSLLLIAKMSRPASYKELFDAVRFDLSSIWEWTSF